MENPLHTLKEWINEEMKGGNPFPQGAVLSTVADGMPRSRMVGTMLDENELPVFHTSPLSRKVEDIKRSKHAALTYAFQRSQRSVSLEGSVSLLQETELEQDWLKFDADFRRHYLIFGAHSGSKLICASELVSERGAQKRGAEEVRPASFIGYKFDVINRICFYSVTPGDFASCEFYELDAKGKGWIHSRLVP